MSNSAIPTAVPTVHTPCNSTYKSDTIVFLRTNEEPKPDLFFVPNSHSITLKDLAEEYNISSVIECDTNGAVQPRAVAFDSPSDVLHSGHHYIARRDAKVDNGGSRVTFKGKILVQEFDLPTPPQSYFMSSAPSFTNDLTPMHKGGPATAAAQQPFQQAVETQQKDRKRFRDGDNDDEGEEYQEAQPQTTAQPPQRNAPLADTTNEQPVFGTRKGNGQGKDDGGASGALTHGAAKLDTSSATAESGAPSSGAGRPNHVTQFMPFMADLHGQGEDVLVTLDSLKELCKDWEREKDENERKHADAMEVLENTRRVLFLNP